MQGQIFKITYKELNEVCYYVVTRVDHDKYLMINLQTFNRLSEEFMPYDALTTMTGLRKYVGSEDITSIERLSKFDKLYLEFLSGERYLLSGAEPFL